MTGEELESLRGTTRRFVRQRLRPLEESIEQDDRMPEEWAQLCRESIELGLYSANVPADYGGSGLSLTEQLTLWEEFGQVSWPLTYVFCSPNLVLLDCSDAQRDRYLSPVVAGEKLQCFALTEPDAGSDVYAMRTTAQQSAGGYVLNGTKHFITRAGEADFAIVFAVTKSAANGSRPEVTAFLIDSDTPGYEVGRRQPMMGWRGLGQHEVVMRDCFVERGNVLGEPGRGLELGLGLIAQARMSVSAYCVGFMERLIETSLEFAGNREVFGSTLARKQGIQWMLAEMEIDAYVARATMQATAVALEAGTATAADVSKVKYQATRALGRVADATVEIHGGAGWCKDLPVERMYRDARVFRLIDGTDEVHKGMVWRSMASRLGGVPSRPGW